MNTRLITTRAIGNLDAERDRWLGLCAFTLNTGGIGWIPFVVVIVVLFDLLRDHAQEILVMAPVSLTFCLIYPLLANLSDPMNALGIAGDHDAFARHRILSLFPIGGTRPKARP